MQNTVVITVHGTHGRGDDWAKPQFEHWNKLQGSFIVHQFLWCGAIDGLFGADDCWKSWGGVLADTIRSYAHSEPRPLINLVCHSHGGQVAAHALSMLSQLFSVLEPKPVDTLITVSTPNRKSMIPVYESALASTSHWYHFYGDWYRDWISSLGRLGSKWTPSLARKLPNTVNYRLEGHGHTSMLYDPLFYHTLADLFAN